MPARKVGKAPDERIEGGYANSMFSCSSRFAIGTVSQQRRIPAFEKRMHQFGSFRPTHIVSFPVDLMFMSATRGRFATRLDKLYAKPPEDRFRQSRPFPMQEAT